ncbi:hypothetical protein TNCV_619361, partial [Trichonephila clavipes]
VGHRNRSARRPGHRVKPCFGSLTTLEFKATASAKRWPKDVPQFGSGTIELAIPFVQTVILRYSQQSGSVRSCIIIHPRNEVVTGDFWQHGRTYGSRSHRYLRPVTVPPVDSCIGQCGHRARSLPKPGFTPLCYCCLSTVLD